MAEYGETGDEGARRRMVQEPSGPFPYLVDCGRRRIFLDGFCFAIPENKGEFADDGERGKCVGFLWSIICAARQYLDTHPRADGYAVMLWYDGSDVARMVPLQYDKCDEFFISDGTAWDPDDITHQCQPRRWLSAIDWHDTALDIMP